MSKEVITVYRHRLWMVIVRTLITYGYHDHISYFVVKPTRKQIRSAIDKANKEFPYA